MYKSNGLARSHLPYIDCLRGYAILLVITCHLSYVFPELPYPIHRLAVSGWFGVQLFFLASCLTLLQSWHSELKRAGKVSIPAFFIRRFFRIAPAYYLAAILYSYIHPTEDGYGLGNILRSIVFINGISPGWAVGSHSLVPGGWSIGVEFAFYAIFPLFALFVTSLSRAAAMFCGSLALGWIANLLALKFLSLSLPAAALSNGLFFWFPNQLSVFSLGAIAYFLIKDHGTTWRQLLERRVTVVAMTGILLFFALQFVPLGHFIGDGPFVPASLAVSAAFLIVIVALSSGPSIFVNRAVANMGKVSFSAYLVHFAILEAEKKLPDILLTHLTGYRAALWFIACWPLTVLATFTVSLLSFKYIEEPAISIGKSVNQIRAKYAEIAVEGKT